LSPFALDLVKKLSVVSSQSAATSHGQTAAEDALKAGLRLHQADDARGGDRFMKARATHKKAAKSPFWQFLPQKLDDVAAQIRQFVAQ
jgi:hypothetical protein